MPKKKHQASQKTMNLAYEAAKSGKMSIREAAKKYKIPKSTLIDKVKGKSPLDCKKGPKPILSPMEEKALVDWGVRMAGIGFTCIKTQVIYTVKRILDKDEKEGRGREKRFGDDNLPGKDWWGRFCERHLKLKRANDQVIERAKRLAKSHAALSKWQAGLKKVLQRCNIKDPSCIFTCMANRFQLDGRGGVVGCHLRKKIPERAKYLTVLTASSANGMFVPPMMVYPGELVEDVIQEGAVEGTFFTKSRNGNMNVELFYCWLGNHFTDYIPEEKNILLLIDGNWPYVDMYVSRLCKDKNIIMYCMPPKSYHFQSPLAWGFLKQLPNEWKMESMNFELLNPGLKVDKYAFPAVFSNVWTHLASETHIKTAFERSGIWPVESKGTPRLPAASDHVTASCFDEEGNEIEVGLYEEVASEHLQAEMEISYEPTPEGDMSQENANDDDSGSNVLRQFEKAQGVTAEQREVFETRFLLDFEEPRSLIYNAWKALKELMVMTQDKAEDEGKSESKWDTDGDEDDYNDEEEDDDVDDIDDDDDSLLDWLSDESDEDAEDDKENDKKDSASLQRTNDKTGESVREPKSGEEEEEDQVENALVIGSSSSNSPSQVVAEDEEEEENLPRSSPRGSSSRTAMSPLKITRYTHPGAAGKRKRPTTSKPQSGNKKKKSKGRKR